jgi:pimeloyl-ACP methyl ester carboxylesterase
MSALLSPWPGVVDTWLDVGGRPVRVLRVDSGRADGGGEPQLLVHGLGGSSVTWVEIMAGLAKHGPVVAVDLPGFGRTSPRDDDALTVRGYVEFVVDVADELGWDRFALHGNSMGGLIAVLLAARHPERVDRLVLVSPALPPRSPLGLLVPARATVDGMAPIAVSTFSAAVLGVVGIAGPELTEHRNRQLLKLIYADPDGVDRAVLELMAADFTGDDATTARSRRRALRSATRSIAALWADPRRVWRAIDRVKAPTLVLGGTRDALVPAKVLRAVLARRPDWTGRVLDDRRHALMMEDPATYLEEFARWCDATDRAA